MRVSVVVENQDAAQAEGELVFQLPDGAAELLAEALRRLALDPTCAQALSRTQAAPAELCARAEEAAAQPRAADETRLARLTEELAAARADYEARLGEREAQAEQQTGLLLNLRAELDKKDEALEWVYTSRTWRLASRLRRLRDWPRRWRQYAVQLGRRARLPVRPVFYGRVETPTEAASVVGELRIEGWVFSAAAPVVRVEAFLDDRYLGRLNYGLKRADVAAAYPALARAECGFSEVVPLKANTTGERALVVRAYDALGHVHIYTRLVVVSPPKTLLRPANANGDARAAHAPAAAAQQAHANGHDASYYRQLETLVDEFRSRTESAPAILDWHTGLNLAAALPELAVFSPPVNGRQGLPYLSRTVDIVVVPAGEPRQLAEARRVAAAAVVQAHGAGNGHAPAAAGQQSARVRLEAEWMETPDGATLPPSVSVIIPVYNKVEYTEQCLARVVETMPPNFRGEIIVVDDASTDETPTALARWAHADARIRVLRQERNQGFIASCNAGAAAARGDVLVFLNNDTLPQADWLPPLLRVLREHADAGAVGGKLLYPDGTLQEAGGVIFADGTGCNFGRDDRTPDAALYSYVRAVDYCSGALLATPRALFRELGGFDARFAPAYYEDTDYCFGVRAAGRKVYYQPESVVIHFEGVSSGTDARGGVKRYQELNRAKFVAKWRDALRRQPVAPAQYNFNTLHALAAPPAAADGARPRRALVCAPHLPAFDREGGARRLFHLIEFLRETGWAVSFAAHDGTEGERYARALQQLGVATYAARNPWAGGRASVVNPEALVATGHFDLLLVAFWEQAESYLPVVPALAPATKVVVDSVDLHFLRKSRRAFCESGETAGRLDPQYAHELIRELNTYAAADAVLTVSQKEAELINDFVGDAELAHAVPDTEDLPAGPLPFAGRAGLLFVGNFRHAPNVQAVEWLCREILPRVAPELLAEHPVYVVGNGVSEARIDYGCLKNVHLIGWVPSVRPYLHSVRLSVTPLRYGAGTKRKLMQSLMAGTPAVSTSIGVEGLNLEAGRHVLVADDAARFARGIERLLTDEALWQQLSLAGREHVLAAHGRANVRARFAAVLERILDKPAKAAAAHG
ncbi:MAG TPA: glycosyltransferase [Pyrinomonadaceae bacterium]|jgi:GT2 family glycosyltransferase